ncbi:MAG: hypothetical protein Harvfovirus29_13 [Harvfovirus sp.]|uniref:Uncharacterized protein n=1 Tax=Harvfovirus sp. TaxID=2487768 RepID=A0A3G5A4E7_9VIRU|nr:MAG: hypothetical protein Harvfovirus29_13 [Harvfovirus sp.]
MEPFKIRLQLRGPITINGSPVIPIFNDEIYILDSKYNTSTFLFYELLLNNNMRIRFYYYHHPELHKPRMFHYRATIENVPLIEEPQV